ncbi:Hypothetical_protein [Hexamita inflata]|uniref:Hypothetical_protein n=1 Tax=Hexamita inflata TaxID=28002 RepID=A0ABP1HPN9_9EUKA
MIVTLNEPPQTTQVSSALELTLLTSEVIFVTIFGMAGMNLGTSVSAATRSASKFRAGNNVITLQSVSSCSGSFTLESETSAIYQLHKICVCVLLFYIVSSIRISSCITGSESRISFQFILKLTYSLLSVLCGADTTYGINGWAVQNIDHASAQNWFDKMKYCVLYLLKQEHINETRDQLNSSIKINQNEILLSLTPAIQEEIQMELRMPNKTTVTKILTQQQNVQISFQRKATPQNRQQDNQFMTLFPGLNLDQIRNNANTITRNSPTQPKAVINKKISKTNSISPKELMESL